jgi:hypothetical protein
VEWKTGSEESGEALARLVVQGPFVEEVEVMRPERLHVGEWYKVSARNVVAQVIEGEALLIAFETGSYYSVVGSGARIVSALRRGAPLGQLLSAFSRDDRAEAVAVEHGVRTFLEELMTEGLIERIDALDAGAAPVDLGESEPPLAFEMPVLRKYSDLEDLLLLDPIHDVDAAGWPLTKALP